MISMSWNVQQTDKTESDPRNVDEIAQLEKAISFVVKEKNILMYDVAGDQQGDISMSTKWVPCDFESTISIDAIDINDTRKRICRQ